MNMTKRIAKQCKSNRPEIAEPSKAEREEAIPSKTQPLPAAEGMEL